VANKIPGTPKINYRLNGIFEQATWIEVQATWDVKYRLYGN
jgi:hypothetical protein